MASGIVATQTSAQETLSWCQEAPGFSVSSARLSVLLAVAHLTLVTVLAGTVLSALDPGILCEPYGGWVPHTELSQW